MPTHARTPPYPLGEPESKKIGFVAPMLKFPSAKIHKTINMLCKHSTTNDKNEMVQTLNKMVHLKYPILEIWCCHKHITQLPPSRLKFDTKLRKVFPDICSWHQTQ